MKSEIIARLGQTDILLPSLIAEGLAANDRVKARMSVLQAAGRHARDPGSAKFELTDAQMQTSAWMLPCPWPMLELWPRRNSEVQRVRCGTMMASVRVRMLAALPADGAGPIGQPWLQTHHGSAYHTWHIGRLQTDSTL